jgi:hypothetical protein
VAVIWTEDEDSKLKDAVLSHGGKHWAAIAALVPGRRKTQCRVRWNRVLKKRSEQAIGHTGTWAEDEDIKLKDAVQIYGGKNWDAITALVPGRTQMQCSTRWHNDLDRSIDLAPGRSIDLAPGYTGTWTEDEDSKLKDAAQTHGGKDWAAIAALVPGRTIMQCSNRWHYALDPSIDRVNGRMGDTWTEDEDSKLKDAVQAQCGVRKNWVAIAALFPDRTTRQCATRWHKTFGKAERKGTWTEDEDSKLKDSVRKHGGKNWGAIATLVPGRAKKQCRDRWHNHLLPIIDGTPGRQGARAEDEVIELKHAVHRTVAIIGV